MTINRSAIGSLIKKIHKETSGKGMDDDVPAVIKRAVGGKVPMPRPKPKEYKRTLESVADELRGSIGDYKKEKQLEENRKNVNERIRAVLKTGRGAFGAKYAEGGYTGGGDQPAALSEGEYVIPADVVSMLGDGNSEAGAKILEQFCKQIRQQKGKHLAKGRQAPPLI